MRRRGDACARGASAPAANCPPPRRRLPRSNSVGGRAPEFNACEDVETLRPSRGTGGEDCNVHGVGVWLDARQHRIKERQPRAASPVRSHAEMAAAYSTTVGLEGSSFSCCHKSSAVSWRRMHRADERVLIGLGVGPYAALRICSQRQRLRRFVEQPAAHHLAL